MRFALAALIAAVGFASSASADVTKVTIDQVDNGGGNDTQNDLANTVTNAISIDFDGQLGGQQIYLDLTSGSVINHPFGSDTAPTAALVGSFANLAFDTFVTIGGDTTANSEGTLVVGNAVNIPGAGPQSLGPDEISVAWAPGTGVVVADQSNYLMSHITLTDDAEGTFFYFGSTIGGGTATPTEFSVVEGVIGGVVPEPSTALLIGLATCGVATLRNRG